MLQKGGKEGQDTGQAHLQWGGTPIVRPPEWAAELLAQGESKKVAGPHG